LQHVTNTSRSDTVEMSPSSLTNSINEDCRSLQAKYDITGRFYDILDYPWERQYRRWRPGLLKDVRGKVLEAGVGTGRNLKYYHPGVKLTAVDLSKVMLRRAMRRAKSAVCKVDLCQEDATVMNSIPSNHFDWLISTFLCCVMPDELQPKAENCLNFFHHLLKRSTALALTEIP